MNVKYKNKSTNFFQKIIYDARVTVTQMKKYAIVDC